MKDLDFMSMYQKFTGTQKGFTNYQLKLVNVALQFDETGEKILEEVTKEKYAGNISNGLSTFIKMNGGKCPLASKSKPVQISLFEENATKEETSVKPSSTASTSSSAEGLGSYLGLLEKTLAEVIVKNQGESIRNEIISNFEEIAKQYMTENYGIVQKKIEVQVGEVKTQFNEILHEKFDTVLKFVQNDEPVFLTGNAGTGKNVLCKQVAKALGLDFYFTNAVTQEYKLTGFTDASGIYHKTQFYDAFTKGGLFMLDEMDASIPEVLVILNCAIANRYFDFPSGKDENGNQIGGYTEAHPNFRIISAGNTFGLGADMQYVGRNQLDMASLNRFAVVEVEYDRRIEESVAKGDIELCDFIDDMRRVSSSAGIMMVISYRDIGRIVKMKSLLPLEEVMKTCLIKNLRADDISTLVSGMTVVNAYTKAVKSLIK